MSSGTASDGASTGDPAARPEAVPPRSRLRVRDAVTISLLSIRTRRLRAALTCTGTAIGIAAMVAVLGISASSRAELIAALDALGTNLLTTRPGQSFVGAETALPSSAPAAVRRVDAVQQAAATAELDAFVRRSDYIPRSQTGGIHVAATEVWLLDTLQADLAAGQFFDTSSAEHPTVVLGATAARRLGVEDLEGQPLVWLGDQWFAVVGILHPVLLAPEIDSSALVGFPAAAQVLDVEPASLRPTAIYVRAEPGAIDSIRLVLPRTANPESPEAVRVSRPSDALAARDAADRALTALLLGLGGVALLVGGIGIANVMVVAVLERRTEIGLRRALGATRRHIAAQFLLEAVALSAAGGVAGIALGAGITAAYAAGRGWPFALPPQILVGAATVVVMVGALAGVYPASRAARLQPSEAIRPSS